MDSHVVAIIGETGILMPVLGASNDNGDTFGKTIMLNSVGQLSYFYHSYLSMRRESTVTTVV